MMQNYLNALANGDAVNNTPTKKEYKEALAKANEEYNESLNSLYYYLDKNGEKIPISDLNNLPESLKNIDVQTDGRIYFRETDKPVNELFKDAITGLKSSYDTDANRRKFNYEYRNALALANRSEDIFDFERDAGALYNLLAQNDDQFMLMANDLLS